MRSLAMVNLIFRHKICGWKIPDVCSMFQEGLSGLHVLEIIGDDGGFKLFCENAQSNVYAAYLLFQVVPFPSNAVSSAARFRME